jgi:hypothetical protein
MLFGAISWIFRVTVCHEQYLCCPNVFFPSILMLSTQMQEFALVWRNKMFCDTTGRSWYCLKECIILKRRGSKGAVLWSQKHFSPVASELHLFHIFPANVFDVCFSIILPVTQYRPKQFLPLLVYIQNFAAYLMWYFSFMLVNTKIMLSSMM